MTEFAAADAPISLAGVALGHPAVASASQYLWSWPPRVIVSARLRWWARWWARLAPSYRHDVEADIRRRLSRELGGLSIFDVEVC